MPDGRTIASGSYYKTEELETIESFALAPWESRIGTVADGSEVGPNAVSTGWAVRTAVSSSARNGLVGFVAAIEYRRSIRGDCLHLTRAVTLGQRTEQNPYCMYCTRITIVWYFARTRH